MRPKFLSVSHISWHPPKAKSPIVHPLSFDLNKGETLGVIGANGAGKSTLLRMLYRYQKPEGGQILLEGKDIWKMPARLVAQHIAAVLQEQPTDFALSVWEIVALGRTPYRKGFSSSGIRDKNIIENALTCLNLDHFSDRSFGTLSGGERQRVMVARALAQEPDILILDEPTNHLDIRHQLEILDMIRSLDLTIITSLHDLNIAADICDKVLVMQSGQMQAYGHPRQVLTEELVSDAFNVTACLETLRPSEKLHFTYNLKNGEIE